MRSVSNRTQLIIGIILAMLMGVTRGYHFTALEPLPSASWAVFFLAGVYLRSRWVFPALLAEAALLDFVAITWGGVSSFCVSPAYGFLLPAYGTLWLAGHWYAKEHHDRVTTLLPLAISMVVGVAVCELISSGSFYVLSGRFDQITVAAFSSQFAQYFPQSLVALAFYAGLAGLAHLTGYVARMVTAPYCNSNTST